MCNFSAGPWCVECVNAKEIRNPVLFQDYVDYLPHNSTYELRTNYSTTIGYVCKNAINSQCEKGDFLC